MTTNILKSVMAALMVLFSLNAHAYDVEIDGIYYNIYEDLHAVQVTKGDNPYSGEVIIPSAIETGGVTYGVEYIEANAFAYCKGLTSVTIPSSVTYIGNSAFAGCTGLTLVVSQSPTPPVAKEYSFLDVSALVVLQVPEGSIDAYKVATGWSYLYEARPLHVKNVTLDGIAYQLTIETKTAEVVKEDREPGFGVPYSYELIIPSTVTDEGDEYAVTSIRNGAFSECTGIIWASIPKGVTSIGERAFYHCQNMTSVTIPESVTSIGEWAFKDCWMMTSVTIPKAVTTIGANAFDNGNLSRVFVEWEEPFAIFGKTAFSEERTFNEKTFNNATLYVPEGTIETYKATDGWKDFSTIEEIDPVPLKYIIVDGIGYKLNPETKTAKVVKEDRDIEEESSSKYELIIPASLTYEDDTYAVTSIDEGAFKECMNITAVTIPNSVTSIGASAFDHCKYITSVTVSDGITSIADKIFFQCSSLTSFAIPESVTSIGVSAFEGCSDLTSVVIPNSITSISDFAFSDCSSLTSASLPNGISSIGADVFNGCSKLTSVMIPNTITSISNRAFEGCSSLTSVEIPNSVTEIGQEAFSGCTSLTSLIIPNNVRKIEYATFSFCTSLTSISLPNSITSISNYAFNNCFSLTSVDIPEGITSISEGAFRYCSNLKSIMIPNSVLSIGGDAFKGCFALTSVEIPNSVTKIGEEAFSYCTALTSVEIPSSVTSLGMGVFEGVDLSTVVSSLEAPFTIYGLMSAENKRTFSSNTFNNATLYVPEGTIEKYKATEGWKDFVNIVEGDPVNIAGVSTKAFLIKNEGGKMMLEGVNDGERINVYTTNGMQAGSAISKNGKAMVDTNLPKGSIAIVKIGNKSVKVLVK